MKKGIHPENYRLVAFKDMSNDHVFLCRSAVSTKETIEVNGETYPVYKMEISNTSHPFYTGKMKLVDTAGRVDKFMSRKAAFRSAKCGLFHCRAAMPPLFPELRFAAGRGAPLRTDGRRRAVVLRDVRRWSGAKSGRRCVFLSRGCAYNRFYSYI